MCNHRELEYKYTIEATTSIFIYEHDELGESLSCNNEYGHMIKEDVYCLECGKHWKINGRTPKFVADFVAKVNKML